MDHSVAGIVGGSAGALVAHPFDLLKVRMQTGDGVLGSNSMSILFKTVKSEGISALFRGVSFPLLGYIPMNVVVFGAYGKTLRKLEEWKESKSRPQDAFIAGTLAGVIQVPICAPIETLKIRMQSQLTGGNIGLNKPETGTIFRGPIDAMRSIFKEYGVRGYFQGFSATLLRDSVGYGLYFFFFVTLCQSMTRRGEETGHVATFLAGGFGGMATYAVCYPLDTVKSRIQSSRTPLSLFSTTKELWGRHGLTGFYRGLGPTLLRAFPENATILYTYDRVVKLFEAYGYGSDA
uniref:Mitochondrial carrier protein n=1 Tax=Amorphochlora amoebiformis TaxID=1561963 RepID=A0A7S0CVV9_9EUKA